MKALLLLAITIVTGLIAGSAHASRPDVRKMTCRDAAGLVDSTRAVVFTTGKFTYERVVSSRYACPNPNNSYISETFAKTLDHDRCFVGYVCHTEEVAGNGSSVIGASAPVTCKEGKIQTFTRRTTSDETVYERVQCRSGKWKLLDI